MFNILVAEDDLKLRQMLCAVLLKNGYHTTAVGDGEQALVILEREYIDLMVCDIMMPRMDGYELTKTLREGGNNLPILMVTARDTFSDKQRGFGAGADDYMVKPIDVNELLLRINALLRRAKISSERRIVCGEVVLDYDALTVSGDGFDELLPQKEFYLLYKLLSYSGKIFTRRQLMDEIWGPDIASDERTVDVHVNRIRERFRSCNAFEIVTVRGLGYKAVKNV